MIYQEGAGPRARGMPGAAPQSCPWQEILLQGQQHHQTQPRAHTNTGFPRAQPCQVIYPRKTACSKQAKGFTWGDTYVLS